MRVADFIDAETDAILSGWEEIARTLLPAASSLDNLALRVITLGPFSAQFLQTCEPRRHVWNRIRSHVGKRL